MKTCRPLELLNQLATEMGPDKRRYLAVVKEAESIIVEITAERVCLELVLDNYRGLLQETGIAPATGYNHVYRLNKLLKLAVKRGEFVEAVKVSDFPVLPPPDNPIEFRLIKHLSHFIKYCAERSIAFSSITPAIISDYRDHLKHTVARSTAEARYNDLIAVWKKCAWPAIEFQPFTGTAKNHYSIPYPEWPADWKSDFDEFCQAAQGRGPRRTRKRISTKRIKAYQELTGTFRAFCETSGYSKISLRQLLSEVTPVSLFIQWHCETRCSGVIRDYHAAKIMMFAYLDTVLSSRDRAQEEYLKQAAQFVSETVKDSLELEGLSLKRLFNAADDAIEEIDRLWRSGSLNLSKAIRCRNLLIFALLCYRPLRATNVVNLDLKHGLCLQSHQEWLIRIAARAFKGRRNWEGTWPQALNQTLELYIREILPLFLSNTRSLLFPSKSSSKIAVAELTGIIKETSLELLGRAYSTHQFRSIVGTLYLLEYPDELWLVQQLLGHRFIATTLKHYIHITQRQASLRVGEFACQHCEHARMVATWTPPTDLTDMLNQTN